MLSFKPFTAQAMLEMKPLLELQSFKSCDYTLGGLFMWRDYFKQKYAIHDNMLIATADYLDRGLCYSFPVGRGSISSALFSIREDAAERGIPLRFCCVPSQAVPELIRNLGEPVESVEYRDWEDYLYPYENFLGYHGKKLVTPRNHCNRFIRDYPQYEYSPFDETSLAAAKAFLSESAGAFLKDSPIAREEYIRAIEILDHIKSFGFTGGILSVDGKIIGLSVGEIIGDTLYVHIEKALTEYSGAYPMLASLYARQNAAPGIKYINREDDSGDPGLRRSKTEYRPCALVEKYVVDFGLQNR